MNESHGNPVAMNSPKGQVHPAGMSGRALQEKMAWLLALLDRLEQTAQPEIMRDIQALRLSVSDFQLKVAFVGQIKAGKTTLINSLINMPDLLPTDVNPWTSCLTSVHINTVNPSGNRAIFSLFNEDEWDAMDQTGAHRDAATQGIKAADHNVPPSRIKAMQTAAELRFGRNFSYLLGNTHSFSTFNPDLIKRYVCQGDPDDPLALAGRFADLTRSADIYIKANNFALPTIMIDTPGANNPMLIHKKVTRANLLSADVCVLVLSAHQVFGTADATLLRTLLSLPRSQTILFVNRIDELQDPDTQIDAIESQLRSTLADQGFPSDLPVVFGSAISAQSGRDGPRAPDIARRVAAKPRMVVARRHIVAAETVRTTASKLADRTGQGELQNAIETSAVATAGFPFLDRMRAGAIDVCQQSADALRRALDTGAPVRDGLDQKRVMAQLDQMVQRFDAQSLAVGRACADKLVFDLSDIYRRFLDREICAIDAAWAATGSTASWQPDTDMLRLDLTTAYTAIEKTEQTHIAQLYDAATKAVWQCYAHVLASPIPLTILYAPRAASARPPAVLMQSATIDMTNGKRDKPRSNAAGIATLKDQFTDAVHQNMRRGITEMRDVYCAAIFRDARHQLHGYLDTHCTILRQLAAIDSPDPALQTHARMGIAADLRARLAIVTNILAELEKAP